MLKIVLMKRAQRSREFWEKVVFEADSSGLTRAKYAESVGVGEAALSHWLTKLRGKSEKVRPTVEAARLMRVQVVDVKAKRDAELSLEHAGVVIRFGEGTSPEYVAKLAKSLGQC